MENDNDKELNQENSGKSQTMFMIGIALIVVGIAIFFVGYTQPKIYVDNKDELSSFVANEQSNEINNISKSLNVNSVDNYANYPININSATYDDLIKIKGIGESKANLIINYRNEIGEFTDINQLGNIKGFGPSTINELRNYLTV